MHTADIGLFVHMLENTVKLLASKLSTTAAGSALREANRRFNSIPRYRDLKVFVGAVIGTPTTYTASERRDQMEVSPFVFRSLTGHAVLDEKLELCFHLYLQHYSLTKRSQLDEDELEMLRLKGLEWGRLFVDLFMVCFGF